MNDNARTVVLLSLILVIKSASLSEIITGEIGDKLLFPKDFIFGVSTSSYQVEGAWNLSGKGESIWDRFVHKKPSLIADGFNGDYACDSYHNFKEDVQNIKNIGFRMYKFSLSWPRILPEGTTRIVNKKGIEYYSQLIDELLSNGIEPMVTLYHWDLPQKLQDHGGWLNSSIVTHFEEYAALMFRIFGKKVRWWVTLEDPAGVAAGYGASRERAPGLWELHGFGEYRAGHNLLLAHAAAVTAFKRLLSGGKISLNLNADYVYPKTNTSEDILAAETAMQFSVGWFGRPVYSRAGNYPPVMRDQVDRNSALQGLSQSRLPYFSPQEIQRLRGSSDFLSLSHLTSRAARSGVVGPNPSWTRDSGVELSFQDSWPASGCQSMKVVPDGLRGILDWLRNEYGDVPMFITQNGYCDEGGQQDDQRVKYYKDYLSVLSSMIVSGTNVIGYCAKSLMDSFEWENGYRDKYGLLEIDFTTPSRTRTMKTSAKYWKNVLMRHHSITA